MAQNYWQGNNIRLRALEESDIPALVARRNAPDSEAEWFYDRILLPDSEEGMKKFYAETLLDAKKDDKCFLMIETHAGETVGHIYVWMTRPLERIFRYGIYVSESHRRNGFAAEALLIVLDYYFNELNYQKCSPTAYSFNTRSHEFHEKLGFIREGTLRNEVYTRGEFFDMVYYGMLKDEFNELHARRFPH